MTRQTVNSVVGRTASRPNRPRVFYGAVFVIALLLPQPDPAAAQDQEPSLRAMVIDGEPDLVEGDGWDLVLALSFWLTDESDEFLDRLERDRSAPAPLDLGPTPEDSLSAMEQSVAPLPYVGSLLDLATVRTAYQANSLDRARLLRAAVAGLGEQARIVSVPRDGENAYVEYPATAPTLPLASDSKIVQLLAEQADRVTLAWPAVCGAGNGCPDWQALSANSAFESEIFWVQILRDGAWVDLLPADTVVYPWARSAAKELTEERLAALTWQVTLRLVAGDGSEVVAHTAPAAHYQGQSVSLINEPVEALSKFQSVLVIDGEEFRSETYAIGSASEVHGQFLDIIISGPGEDRRYRRRIVAPRTLADDAERPLEVATVVRVTIQTSQLSDIDFQRAMALDARASAAHLFDFAPDRLVAVNRNRPSQRAMALLDAAHRTAGHLGAASRQVLAFQARPAIVLERDYVEVGAVNIERLYSLDLIDPGHGFVAFGDDPQLAFRAALEQALVDGALEDWIAYQDGSVTAHRALAGLMESAAPFVPAGPSRDAVTDSYGDLQPLYRTARTATGTVAGWRLDPGPQAVPIIAPGIGGVARTNLARERTKKLCDAISFGAMFVPARVMPTAFLLPAITKYHCKLAEAYDKTANVLDSLFGGNQPQPDVGDQIKDLEEQIKNMGKDLAKDIVLDSLAKSVSAAAGRTGLARGLSNSLSPTLAYFGKKAAEYTIRKIVHQIGDGSEQQAREYAERSYPTDIEDQASQLKAAGEDSSEFISQLPPQAGELLSDALTQQIKLARSLQEDLGMGPAGGAARAVSGGETRSVGPGKEAAIRNVLRYAEKLTPYGYTIRPGGWLDQKITGRFNASHAEKILFTSLDEARPMAVDRVLCLDCVDFFLAASQDKGSDLIIADPFMTYVFQKDGRILGIPH